MLRIALPLILLRAVRPLHCRLVAVGEMEVEGERTWDGRPCPLLMGGKHLVWFRVDDESDDFRVIDHNPEAVGVVYRRVIDCSLVVGVYDHRIPP